jgi:ligand-binding SRPBCC domain-containing protein
MAFGEHLLRSETFLPRSRSEVFAFFANAENLEAITPPEVRFRITSPLPIRMGPGTLIDYQLRLFGMPFTWRTLISLWRENEEFVDEQLNGPYSRWIHSHAFFDAPGGTRVVDEVRYRLPLFPLGELAFPLVRWQLRRIFAYRSRRLRDFLAVGAPR